MGGLLMDAAREYIARQTRQKNPHGGYYEWGWFPYADEERECCSRVRVTQQQRYSLLVHARTARHVAALYGVSEKELRRLARPLKVQMVLAGLAGLGEG